MQSFPIVSQVSAIYKIACKSIFEVSNAFIRFLLNWLVKQFLGKVCVLCFWFNRADESGGFVWRFRSLIEKKECFNSFWNRLYHLTVLWYDWIDWELVFLGRKFRIIQIWFIYWQLIEGKTLILSSYMVASSRSHPIPPRFKWPLKKSGVQ